MSKKPLFRSTRGAAVGARTTSAPAGHGDRPQHDGTRAGGLPSALRRDHSEQVADALHLDAIDKDFGGRRVLNGVSLTLRQRKVLALCGPSGCGKTTLLRIISGLLPFNAGHLRIGVTTIQAEANYPAALYGTVGMIFQEHNLFPHMTAIANVTLALREVRRMSLRQAHERGMAELDRMGAVALAGQYPSTLSGGEKQRVAIARALAMDPLFLLLDEPTANLDPDRVDEVRERVIELANAGTTMLLVTHNVQFAREAAKSFALLQGGVCHVSDDPAILEGLRAPRK